MNLKIKSENPGNVRWLRTPRMPRVLASASIRFVKILKLSLKVLLSFWVPLSFHAAMISIEVELFGPDHTTIDVELLDKDCTSNALFVILFKFKRPHKSQFHAIMSHPKSMSNSFKKHENIIRNLNRKVTWPIITNSCNTLVHLSSAIQFNNFLCQDVGAT